MKRGVIIGIVVGVVIIFIAFFLFNYIYRGSINNENLTNNSEINFTEEEFVQEPEEIDPNNFSNSICNQLPLSNELGSEEKYYCLAVVNHNPSFCGYMLNDSEDIGVLEESEILDDLNDTTPYDICLAISTEDSSYCKTLSKLIGKKTCYNTLSQLIWNINICDEIDYSEEDKQVCYFNFVNALYWENKSNQITTEYCSKIEDNMDEKTCLAFKSQDVSLCGSNKNCLTFFPQEMSFCDGATFKGEDECIRDRALINKNISICAELSEQTGRDDCYLDFSGHIQPSIATCDKIIDVQRRQGCYINVAINLRIIS